MAPPVESSSAYEELPILIVRLKLAAIDAYMREDGWTLNHEHYCRHWSGNFIQVSRPNENRPGGLVNVAAASYTPDPATAWIQERLTHWDTIKSNISIALAAWGCLPDPETLEVDPNSLMSYYGRDAHDAAVALAVGDSGHGGGSSRAAGHLDEIEKRTLALEGLTFQAFSANFLVNVRRAISGSCALVVVLGQALNGEAELWKRARESTAEIVKKTTQSFKRYAEWSHDTTTVTLKVTGAVIAGATALATAATGGMTIALAGATGGAMVTLLSEIHSDSTTAEEERNLAGGSYSDIWNAFIEALNALNKQIKDEENLLEEKLNENQTNATRDPGFDIHKNMDTAGGPGTTQLLGVAKVSDLGTDMKTDSGEVAGITKVFLPHVADELEGAQRILMRTIIPDNLPWVRSGSIGIGEKGPWLAWNQLAWTIWSLLGDLAWECRENAKILDIIDQSLHATDEETAKRLDALLLQTAKENRPRNEPDPFGRV